MDNLDKVTLDFVFEKLDNRIQMFERDLKRLDDLKDSDLNQEAISDIAFVIDLSRNALIKFKEEIKEEIDKEEMWVE